MYFGRIAEEEGGVEVRDREAGGGERDASSSCRLRAETPGCSAKTQLINEGAGSPVPAAINTPNIWSKRKPLGGQTQSAELALPEPLRGLTRPALGRAPRSHQPPAAFAAPPPPDASPRRPPPPAPVPGERSSYWITEDLGAAGTFSQHGPNICGFKKLRELCPSPVPWELQCDAVTS